MAKKFKVTFYLRSGFVAHDGTIPILVRLYLDGSRITLGSTGCSAPKESWNSKTGRMEGKSGAAKYTNNELERIETDLNYIFRRLEFSDDLSLETIKAKYLGVNSVDDCTSYTEFEQLYLAKIKEEVGIRIGDKAYSRYVNSVTHFDNFIKTRYNKADLRMNEFKPDIIDGFVKYLYQTLNLGQNTVMKKVQNIKTIVEKARKKGLMTIDPFIDFRFRFKESERTFLSEDDVNSIMKKKFSCGRLEFVRDMFVFSCFTGLAYVDLFQLTSENLKMIGDNLWIMTHRKKTDVPSRILLLDLPKKIIAKYAGKSQEGKLFPDMSNQKVNEYLKEIGAACGIEQNLTFHVARHTFATMLISKGVPIESVSKMLGHTNIRTTEIYAKITNKKIEKDMLDFSTQMSGFNLEGLGNEPSRRMRESVVKPIDISPNPKHDIATSRKRKKAPKSTTTVKTTCRNGNDRHKDAQAVKDEDKDAKSVHNTGKHKKGQKPNEGE